MEAQLDFLQSADSWLKEYKNQKKYAITENDSNPRQSKLCLYVIGGWAINRYDSYRDTNDLDVLAQKKQLKCFLDDVREKFRPAGNPNTSDLHTTKYTLKKAEDIFSLEARFFDDGRNGIDFGDIFIERDWLYQGSDTFNERTISALSYVRVPSFTKLIALKFIAIAKRGINEKEKIEKDFRDINNIFSEAKRNEDAYLDEIGIILNKHLKISNDYFKQYNDRLNASNALRLQEGREVLPANTLVYNLMCLDKYPIVVSTKNIMEANSDTTYNIILDNEPSIGAVLEQTDISHQLVSIIQHAYDDIHIFISSAIESTFLDFLMILAAKKIDGTNVEIIYFDETTYMDRTYSRIRLFKFLGFKVKICKPHKTNHFFTGVITDPNTAEAKLLTLKPSPEQDELFGESIFVDSSHEMVINYLFNSIKKDYFQELEYVDAKDSIKIIELDRQKYLNILKNVNLYRHLKDSDFIFKIYSRKDLDKLWTKQRGVKEFKKLQHGYVYNMLNLDKQKIYAINLLNNIPHVINIPIVEVFEGKHYLIEGHTRLFELLHGSKKDKILVLEIKGIIDRKAYENYVSHFSKIAINAINPKISKSKFSRDIEKFTHIKHYMDFSKEGIANTLKLFPLELDPI